jgi:sterol 14alpha-demethylase
MGLLQEVTEPLVQQFQAQGLATQVGIVAFSVIFLSVVLNVAQQLLFRNPNEPPLVFHWFPLIGSTVTYGMDPPTFFKEMRAKVWYQTSFDCARRLAGFLNAVG